jgi:hypothetical protein
VDPTTPWRRQRASGTLSLSGVLLVAGGLMIALIGVYFAVEDVVTHWIR